MTDIEIPDRIRPSIALVIALTIVVAVGATYLGAQRLFQAQAISVATSQHALYLRSLNEAIEQHQHLPFVLGENPLIAERMETGALAPLNDMLERFARASGLEAIYVMTLDGTVVAASNHALPSSFLNQNYGFRPYFRQAAGGQRSDYFAIGVTTGRPGYFVAEPLRTDAGTTIGVIAIKLDISELQRSWEDRGENVLAINGDGVVVMSSNPEWLYQTVDPLDREILADIAQSRQFGAQEVGPLDWSYLSDRRVMLDNRAYLLTSGPTDLIDWTVHYLVDVASVQRQTALTTVVLGAFITGLVAFSVFLRSRRIKAALDLSQMQREALIETNKQLVTAQEELARRSKLAALGQLAASVTHELGQPISAFKNHLYAAEIGGEITSSSTLGYLRRLADRMEGITKQLRFFARHNREAWKATDLSAVIAEALMLVDHDVQSQGVALSWTPPNDPAFVFGNKLELEQAMVNLLRNAIDAVRDADPAEVQVTCDRTDETVTITVTDSGEGLKGQTLDTLQEPFFSTQSSGDGMGLGLAITAEIVRSHKGQLSATDHAQGGASFALHLPILEDAA